MISYKDVGDILVVNNAKSKLLLINFDLTMTSENFHNIISNSKEKNRDKQWNLVKHILPKGSAKDWMFIIQTAIANGYGVGIVAFNGYEQIVKRYIKDVIFERKDLHLLEHIYIKCEFPKDYDPATSNKNAYIQEAKIFFNFQGNNNDIIFVDDSQNIEAAEKEGYQTILADKSDHENKFVSKLIIKVQLNESQMNEMISLIQSGIDEEKNTGANTRAMMKKLKHVNVNIPEKHLLLPAEKNTSVSLHSLNMSRKNAHTIKTSDSHAIRESISKVRRGEKASCLPTETAPASLTSSATPSSTTITIKLLKNMLEAVLQFSCTISADKFFIFSMPLAAEKIHEKRLILIEAFKAIGIDVTEGINKGKTIDIVNLDGTENSADLSLLDEDSIASAQKIRVNARWFQDAIGIQQLKAMINIFTQMKEGYRRALILPQLQVIYNHAYKELKEGCTVLAQAGRASNSGTNATPGDGIARLPDELLMHVADYLANNLFPKKEVAKTYNHYLKIKHKL